MKDFNYKEYLKHNPLLKEGLNSFPSEDGSGIHITGDFPGDVYFTTDQNDHENMINTQVTTWSKGIIDANGVTIYYSVGTE